MLKEIQMDMLFNCRLPKTYFDSRGNKCEGWVKGQSRGNYKYDPPIGWIGIGLKVIDMYDSKNIWIGKNNSEGEWAVAYHGIGRGGYPSNEIKKIIGIILMGGFKEGRNQIHKNCEDINHPGKKVGNGVYFTSSIKEAEDYAGIIEINGKKYKTILMVRVKPSSIRKCNCHYIGELFVVNGISEEVRVYRILFKPY